MLNLKTDSRKTIIAILAGLLCLTLAPLSIRVDFDLIRVNLVWSVIFPFVVAMAWGRRYALIAGLAGGALFPFLLWENNGYANLLNFLLIMGLLVMIGQLGFATLQYSYRYVVRKVLLMMFFFGVMAAVNYFLLFNFLMGFNPAFWQQDYVNSIDTDILLGFLFKDFLNYIFLIFTAELALRLPAVRRFMQLPQSPYLAYNPVIISGSLVAAIMVMLIFTALEFTFLRVPANFDLVHIWLALTVIIWSSVFLARVIISFVEKRMMAEEKARLGEESIKAIFNSLNVGIAITDLSGRYDMANNWWPEKIGYTAMELSRKSYLDITHPDDLNDSRRWFQSLIKGEIDNYRLEKRFLCKDGEVFWGDISVSALKNEKGVVSRITGVINDITERKKMEEELNYERNLTAGILESLPGIFFMYNYPELKLQKWNANHVKLLGYSDHELKNKPLVEWHAPEARPFVMQAIEEAMNTGQASIEAPIYRKDGTLVYFYFTAIRFVYRDKMHLLGFGVDISERMKAEQALKNNDARQRAMIANIADVIAIIDKNGVIRYKSPNVEKWFGWRAEELTGEPAFDNIHPDDKQRAINYYDRIALKPGLTDILECRYRCSDGSYKWIEVFANNCMDYPDIAGILINYKDISERRKAAELEKEVVVARRAAEFKQKFLANMSHEIRTPLTGVLGMAEVLLSTSLSDAQKDYVVTLMQSGENLKEIINMILDYSKIEAGQVSQKPSVFKLTDIVEDAGKLFSMMCRRPVEFTREIDPGLPPCISADRQKLGQVVRNLVSNAVKFTAQGNVHMKIYPVSIRHLPADWNEENGDCMIRIEVSDTGAGIPFEKQTRIFEPFYQAEDDYARNVEGTGLGLAICKELVDIMGGSIDMKSYEGKGSTFGFSFRARREEQYEQIQQLKQQRQSPPGKQTKSLNVMLVEDKLINQKVIRLLLNSVGHKIEICSNGEEALAKFEPGIFDLILMDIQMPVMDGIEATAQLKSLYANLPPIIGLSANAFEGDREKYMNQGLDDYLTKPVNLADFSQLIDKMGLSELK